MPHTHAPDYGQRPLPFDLAEGTHAERRNLLGLALLRVAADLHLARFTAWVFDCTAGGADGQTLKKSHKEIAATPWGLCCSLSKARATVGRALQLGLITAAESRYVSGGQTANAYAVDWEGIRALLNCATRPGSVAPHHPKPGALLRQGAVATRQGDVATRHPYKEHISSLVFSSLSVPDRKAGPPPESFESAKAERPGLAALPIAECPELADAESRPVQPLPAERLRHDIFGLLDANKLGNQHYIVEWHRRQLAAARPALPANQAGTLAALAAARYALALPGSAVRKSRVAIFVDKIAHPDRLGPALRYVDRARQDLNKMLIRFPDVLESSIWPPPSAAHAIP